MTVKGSFGSGASSRTQHEAVSDLSRGLSYAIVKVCFKNIHVTSYAGFNDSISVHLVYSVFSRAMPLDEDVRGY